MRYIFELNHPKHFYQFKYIMSLLESKGHTIRVLARDKDVLLKVLSEEKVTYEVFGVHKNSILGKVLSSLSIYRHYRRIARAFKPDIIVSKASLYGVLVARSIGCQSFIFPDSEVVELTNRIVAPLATRVVTPEPFSLNYGQKHIKIKGLFEDCYLSPEILTIDKNYPENNGLRPPYAILRFVGWAANHDINNSGFTFEEKMELAESISKYMTVYISSEKELPDELSKYKLSTPAAQIHQVIANADLYIGDSQTMATEAALLGTPAIRSNSFVGDNDMSNFRMLEEKYGLLLNIRDFNTVLNTAIDFAKESRKEEWSHKRDAYYASVGNANSYITDILEKGAKINEI